MLGRIYRGALLATAVSLFAACEPTELVSPEFTDPPALGFTGDIPAITFGPGTRLKLDSKLDGKTGALTHVVKVGVTLPTRLFSSPKLDRFTLRTTVTFSRDGNTVAVIDPKEDGVSAVHPKDDGAGPGRSLVVLGVPIPADVWKLLTAQPGPVEATAQVELLFETASGEKVVVDAVTAAAGVAPKDSG